MINLRIFSCGGIIKENNKRILIKTNLNYFSTLKNHEKYYRKFICPSNKICIGPKKTFFNLNVNHINATCKIIDNCTIYNKKKILQKCVNFNSLSNNEHSDTNLFSNLKGKEEMKKNNVDDNGNNNMNIEKKKMNYDIKYLKKNENIPYDKNGKSKRNKLFKRNYLKNMHSLLLTKKIKESLNGLKSRHSYKILMKRIKIEKNKINSILIKYQIKKGNLKINFNEHIYRKAIINTKTKIFTFLKRNNNKSLMDIYYEEKKKYKLRKQKLFELQEKFIKNSKIAQSSIKKFFKKYGYVGLTTYFIIFLITFCCSYFCVHYKYISLSDLKYVSEKIHLNKYIDEDLHKKIDSLWGELLFAYIASKISEPLRIVITILITPYIAKVIRLKKKSRIL
ncbi:conserved Plasmodium protein, unknown function [Plasmodium gallinaceum]|uniref:DUF1279 domain-containing protein n=1 Tax=Plasmodium gallinaceum TaxID=5849 RepID=A0A1J1GRG4_PLAGA|nr:conserved Plasmodium protein, unknown function [Plasmodium gallinaceum]CRG95010.1 conserved Plasmodium protein, unknown function [Plasmodium gallinaceum]